MDEGKLGERRTFISLLRSKRMSLSLALMMVLIVFDISLVRIYDSVSKQFISVDTKEILFAVISISLVVIAFFFITDAKPRAIKGTTGQNLLLRKTYQLTRLVQVVLGLLIAYLITQILISASYSTIILTVAVLVSSTLCTIILIMFIVRMTTLLSSNRKMSIMLLFVIAIGFITFNTAIAGLNGSLRLEDRPPETRVFIGGSMDVSKGKYDFIDDLYFYSYLGSFVTAWIATAVTLRYYARKTGKVLFWLIAASPIIFFLAQFASPLAALLSPITGVDRFLLVNFGTLFATLSKPIGGLMLAIGFWSMARIMRPNNPLRNYLTIAGFGILLLFASNQAMLLSIAPYPPFGLATITVTGLSAYLIITGIYASTISISRDAELRVSIRRIAESESRLIDSIATAEIERAIERKVIGILRNESEALENTTGVESSLDENEIKNYLDEVLTEIKNMKTPPSGRSIS